MGKGVDMSGLGGSRPTNTVTRTELDPKIRPYVLYGLEEARRLYDTGAPEFFPGQTYVGPSQATSSALRMAQERATAGSPLTRAAQEQTLANIRGDYLGGNPFFQGAFQPAARAAQESFMDSVNRLRSTASSAGRYGSGAMENLENRALGQFGTALTDVAGKLAYENYATERGRQMAAMGMAPEMASADYADIQRLLTTGQALESYDQAALQDAIARYNFAQNLPAAQLQQYLSAAYGSPMGGVVSTPTYSNPLGNIFGGATAGYALSGGSPYGAVIGGATGLL